MDAGEDFALAGIAFPESSFVVEEPLRLYFSATWDFLLDGRDDVSLSFDWGFPLDGWVIVTDPIVDISGANLIVDGVVPEPISIVTFGYAFIVLRKQKR
jgi:hypothetical protein